jgi:circadian clock protein KaiB
MRAKQHNVRRQPRRSSGLVAQKHPSTKAFESLVAKKNSENQKYLLRLYIAGAGAKSSQALANVREICERHLAGRYELEVIDLYQNAVLAKGEQIIAAPTLIKKLPLPLRKFIGDMSDVDRILVGLDLRPASS